MSGCQCLLNKYRVSVVDGSDAIRNLHDFLAHMGITADVRPDKSSSTGLVIIIETEHFNQHRGWIEAWFTLVDQSSSYSYFYERPRGTGDTK